MPKRSRIKDPNQLATLIVHKATQDKNPHAVALGKLGGLVGGKRRAEVLSAIRRRKIARKAATTRWESYRRRSTKR